MKENYPTKGKKYQDLDDHWLKWELIKWKYGVLHNWKKKKNLKNKTKTQRKRESYLQSRLEELDRRIFAEKNWLYFTSKKRKA